jgi:hypothetical protein
MSDMKPWIHCLLITALCLGSLSLAGRGYPGGDLFPGHDPAFLIVNVTGNNYLEGQPFPDGYYLTSPTWNSTGTRIAVAARNQVSGVDQPSEIWAMDYDAATQTVSNFQQITSSAGGDILGSSQCCFAQGNADLLLFVEEHDTTPNLLRTYDFFSSTIDTVYDPALDTNGDDVLNPCFLGSSDTTFVLGSGNGSTTDRILLFNGTYPSITISSTDQNLDPSSNYLGDRVAYYSTNAYYPQPSGNIYSEFDGNAWTENIYGFGDPLLVTVPGFEARYSGMSDDRILSLRQDLGWSATGLGLYLADGTLVSDLLGDGGTDFMEAHPGRNWQDPAGGILFIAEEFSHTGFGNNLFIAAARPLTAWVDDDWTGPENCGGHAWGYDAFSAVGQAIAAVDEEGTVNVLDGTYFEALLIDKPLTLSGAGAATTVIDGTGLVDAVTVSHATGEVTITGFTVRYADENHLFLDQGDAAALITVTDNVFTGQASPSYLDCAIYGKDGLSQVVFSNNEVSGCASHGCFFERWQGPVEIAHNLFTVPPVYGAAATGHITYRLTAAETDPHHVDEKQWIHDNIIDAGGGSGITLTSCFGWWYNDPDYADGHFTDVEISLNAITNVGDYARGIVLETDGDTGDFAGVVILGNTIFAQNPGSGYSRGIRIMGPATDTVIINNTVSGFFRGIHQSYSLGQPGAVGPIGTQMHNNVISGNVYGAVNQYTDPSNTIDATYGWWGDASGPYHPTLNPGGLGDEVGDHIAFEPWMETQDHITVPWDAPTIQAAVDAAAPSGDTIFIVPGTYEEQVLIDGKYLTLLGSGKANTIIAAPAVLYDSFVVSQGYKCVIGVVNGSVLNLLRVTVDGKAQGNANPGFVGLGFRNSGGSIQYCTVKRISDSPMSGAEHGVAVYAFNDLGTDRSLTLENSLFRDYQKAGIVLSGADTVAEIDQCEVQGAGPTSLLAQNGIQIAFRAYGDIKDCTVSAHCYTAGGQTASGILLYEGESTSIFDCPGLIDNQTGAYFHSTSGYFMNNVVSAGVNAHGAAGEYFGVILSEQGPHGPAPSVFGDGQGSNSLPSSNVTLADCQFTADQSGNGTGISAQAAAGDAQRATAIGLEVTGWSRGIETWDDGGALVDFEAYQCRIADNTAYGILDSASKAVSAADNDWGDASGPYHPTLNPSGLGNEVSDNVLFDPWITGDESLSCNRYTLHARAVESVTFFLDAGAGNGGRNYLLLGGVTGTEPGYPLPGGMANLHLNWDLFTDVVLIFMNSPVFSDFLGSLDAQGSATAVLNPGLLDPAYAGIVFYFAYALNNPFDFASNPVHVTILP